MGETIYSFGYAYPDVIEVGRVQTLEMPVWHDGGLVQGVTATVTLYRPDHTALVSAAAATVSTTTGLLSYSLAAPAATEPLGEGWLQEWAIILPNETDPRLIIRDTVLAKRALRPVVSDADLLGEYPDLGTQFSGLANTFQGFLDHAWKIILRDLIAQGVLAHLVMSPEAFADWHRHLTLHFAFKAMYRGQANDRWKNLYEYHGNEAGKAKSGINYKLDRDQDGFADDEHRYGRGTIIHVNAAPRGRLRLTGRW